MASKPNTNTPLFKVDTNFVMRSWAQKLGDKWVTGILDTGNSRTEREKFQARFTYSDNFD
ncbi:hypothetical protein RirG_147670 [Rhizophagus irregularis DAOM 197198w]|uniref:Uncharacterized protein n=1 Tax=Rhizophagus irregularis (strain DAOM 197198w) TaxID=1432141 RepID=A0A015JAM1_RHIIW|nr:hypothetical protein RirG_147670 [Rhizophagus irregularis DAOM 197198w]